MSELQNPFAPHLNGELSAEVERVVAATMAGEARHPLACSDASVIRRANDPRDRATALRPAFARDIEKLMHLPAYNRLAGKTQVMSFRADDDLTRRGLHVQLVTRVARSIGRALGLNLDLIEAIGLGHDLGHTPFGHTGEWYLSQATQARTGRWFFHNVQSARVLDELAGRNMSLQVIDGALCHNGEFEQQVLRVSDVSDFATLDTHREACLTSGYDAIKQLRPMTLEGCVVRVSDIIAYVGKDRQDAILAGVCREEDFADGLGGAYNAWALNAFVADIVEASAGTDRIAMSEEGFAELRRAKRENYERIYRSEEVQGDFTPVVGDLFCAVYEHEREALVAGDENSAIMVHHVRPTEERLSYYGRTYDWQSDPDRTVVDFISSMTDSFFVALCEALQPGSSKVFPRYHYFNRAGEGA